jgi:hypothetical protein
MDLSGSFTPTLSPDRRPRPAGRPPPPPRRGPGPGSRPPGQRPGPERSGLWLAGPRPARPPPMPATISTCHLYGTEPFPADVAVDGEHVRVIDRESDRALPARTLQIIGSQNSLAPETLSTGRSYLSCPCSPN